jgi:type VI secretion system secreted protein Hcp
MKNWIRSVLVLVALTGVALAPLAEASAALNAYLRLTGQKQGKINGSVTQKGHENSIMVIAVSHEIVSPRDPASGLPTGKRQHKPFVITKELDKSTPILYNALVNNENLPNFDLTVLQPGPKGSAPKAYTVRLMNANIASIKALVGEDGKVIEQVAFTYQKIEWIWADGGIMAMDDWEQPLPKK